MSKEEKFQLRRHWWTPYLCSLIVGRLEVMGYPCRISRNVIYHNKKLTDRDANRIDGYMACLREIGDLLEG